MLWVRVSRSSYRTNGRYPRVSLVATRPGEGLLSEPVAGIRLGSREPVLLPHTCRSPYPSGSAQLGGLPTFANAVANGGPTKRLIPGVMRGASVGARRKAQMFEAIANGGGLS